jgi:hypothetical protein
MLLWQLENMDEENRGIEGGVNEVFSEKRNVIL